MRMSKLQVHVAAWMNVINIMLSGRSQKQKSLYYMILLMKSIGRHVSMPLKVGRVTIERQ